MLSQSRPCALDLAAAKRVSSLLYSYNDRLRARRDAYVGLVGHVLAFKKKVYGLTAYMTN